MGYGGISLIMGMFSDKSLIIVGMSMLFRTRSTRRESFCVREYVHVENWSLGCS